VVKQVVVSNENAIAQHAASSIVLSRSAAPPGLQLFSRSWGPFFLAPGLRTHLCQRWAGCSSQL